MNLLNRMFSDPKETSSFSYLATQQLPSQGQSGILFQNGKAGIFLQRNGPLAFQPPPRQRPAGISASPVLRATHHGRTMAAAGLTRSAKPK
jgi:hypothetical protein